MSLRPNDDGQCSVLARPCGRELKHKIEPGETPEDALRREIREELATEIEVGELLTTVEYKAHPNPPQERGLEDTKRCTESYLILHFYLCCFANDSDSDSANRYRLLEHEDARWLSADELDSVKWLPADEEVIELLKSKNYGRRDTGI